LALTMAEMVNRTLPKRLQLAGDEMVLRMMRLACRPKRVLLKEVYEGWKRLRMPLPRGATFPPLEAGKQVLDAVREVILDLRTRPHLREADYLDAAKQVYNEVRAIAMACRRPATEGKTNYLPDDDPR